MVVNGHRVRGAGGSFEMGDLLSDARGAGLLAFQTREEFWIDDGLGSSSDGRDMGVTGQR